MMLPQSAQTGASEEVGGRVMGSVPVAGSAMSRVPTGSVCELRGILPRVTLLIHYFCFCPGCCRLLLWKGRLAFRRFGCRGPAGARQCVGIHPSNATGGAPGHALRGVLDAR
jgi:hypothetical protein